MTWREAIAAAIRAYILNSLVATVVADIASGLSPADEAIVDAYLDTTMP